MAVFNYKKFKVSLRADSKKTQGLHVGDIVRRQYFDGRNVIYSLMAVLETGTDANDQAYFIGALLEGDEPQQTEILDFARITNLFDTDRSGALYLTASDSQAPYMDVIDGIGRNASLSWPVNVAVPMNEDPQSQYILEDSTLATTSYTKYYLGNSRILHITKNSTAGTVRLKQDFYKYVANPNRVLISYKIKASKAITATTSLEYVDGVRIDGQIDVNVTTDWSYQFHAITVDWSGRHLRSVKIALPNLDDGDEVWIADFNIILLSSVANFGDASQMRLGRLDGMSDPVFGRLNGYGGYLQKLFTSGSAHISGTLTAGDENGFGATFYAGKIHRNVLINSLAPTITGDADIEENVINPTGVGNVYRFDDMITITAQVKAWYQEHIGDQYTFSFWAYAMNPCQITVRQNGFIVGTLQIEAQELNAWKRHSITFDLLEPSSATEPLTISLTPTFSSADDDEISSDATVIAADTRIEYEDALLFSAPQLEYGSLTTQYQATDSILDDTDDYGAWFNRGGIGGTIQNPLLKLNFDGQGSIGTRTRSFLLRIDGSGYFANQNISWNAEGHVTFGEHVTLDWSNLTEDAQKSIIGRKVTISGNDTIVVVKGGNSGFDAYSPENLQLVTSFQNFTADEASFQWQYKNSSGNWVNIDGATSSSYTVGPLSSLWNDDNVIELRIQVTVASMVIYDNYTVRKMFVSGYEVRITSNSGVSFHNGNCQTTLQAKVYYRGEEVTDLTGFAFLWHKYTLPSTAEDTQFWTDHPELNRSSDTLVLNYAIGSQDRFVCVVSTTDMFTYDFPISF